MLGLAASLRPLELEGRRDDADRERADLARDPSDDRRGARAGASTLAGGDEDHVRAAQLLFQLVVRLVGCTTSDVRIGAGAEALGELAADVDLDRGIARAQLLDVGVDGDELDLADAGVDHPVDRVEAGSADTHDLDHREVGAGFGARAVQPRGRLGERLEVARDRRQVGRLELGLGGRRQRLGTRARRRRLRIGQRRPGLRVRRGRRRRRDRRLDTGLLPARDVLDRALVRLGRSLGRGGRGILRRLGSGLAALLRLLLRRLRRLEELR